jgi:Sporulation and spore germination
MRHSRPLFTLLISAALVAPAAIAAGNVATATTVPTLVGIRAAHHPGYDRVVFNFTGGLPSTRSVGYVSQLIADPSGLPIPIAGRAILRVTMSPTNAHNSAGHSTAPTRMTFALPNAMTAVRSGDFEAVTSYGIGLAKKETFKVFTLRNPNRLVVDIKAAFPTVLTKVWLFNLKRFADATEPYFTPVLRPVRPITPATGVMDRIFAGPVPTEYASGLRALLSGATGFTNLRISSGVARVQLTGGCSSGGSTATIAGEIMPSLRQFSTVDFVKIYDPSGHTENPTGRSDSIPVCLEP